MNQVILVGKIKKIHLDHIDLEVDNSVLPIYFEDILTEQINDHLIVGNAIGIKAKVINNKNQIQIITKQITYIP